MKTSKRLFSFIAVVALMIGFVACKKEKIEPPVVKIVGTITTTSSTANVKGEVTDEGGAAVLVRGFFCGKQGAKADTVYCGSGKGAFSAKLAGFEPNTAYVCGAFARNAGGTSYSDKVIFTTKEYAAPTVTTTNVTAITCNSAICGGNVTADGGATVTARGVCYGTSTNPTISGTHTTNGTGTGSFISSLTDLTANTTYYVRAYATNSRGTSYGEQKTFTTNDNKPTVTTNNVTAITGNSATCGGNVTADGGATVTARGVCYGTSTNPTIDDTHTTNGTGTGSFTSSLTGLTANTTYYVRAYATNSKGTSYGEQKTFTTQIMAPTGGINALYSVSSTKKVFFSKGNLQYRASTNTWRFAESQLDYIGNANSNISSSYSGWIDLFGWGTGNNPTNSSTSNSSYSSFTDWGSNPISNGGNQANQWHTLTKDEWSYLLNTRTTSSGLRYAKATVNGVKGLIVLPDDWSTSYCTLSSTNSTSASFSANTITSANWTSKFEAHGAVFLPAAGDRIGMSVYDLGTYGYYWSSAPNGSDSAYCLNFFGSYLSMYYYRRYYGQSVRLVVEE